MRTSRKDRIYHLFADGSTMMVVKDQPNGLITVEMLGDSSKAWYTEDSFVRHLKSLLKKFEPQVKGKDGREVKQPQENM